MSQQDFRERYPSEVSALKLSRKILRKIYYYVYYVVAVVLYSLGWGVCHSRGWMNVVNDIESQYH